MSVAPAIGIRGSSRRIRSASSSEFARRTSREEVAMRMSGAASLRCAQGDSIMTRRPEPFAALEGRLREGAGLRLVQALGLGDCPINRRVPSAAAQIPGQRDLDCIERRVFWYPY